MLEKRLSEWMEKVIAAKNSGGITDTLQMIVDVDKIIAEEFDHEPVLTENK